MDSEVQDPPGQPTAAADDPEELKGLRALFRKRGDDEPAGNRQTKRPAVQSTSTNPAPANGRQRLAKASPSPGASSATSSPAGSAPAGSAPAASAPATSAPAASTPGAVASAPARRRPPSLPLTSRPLINPRMRADPRLRVWVIRVIVSIIIYLSFMLWQNWRLGLTATVIFVAADVMYRSKTMAIVPPSVRVTSAQRYTRRRLKVLHAAGYLALHARTIPGTTHVIDHLVVGPAGVFALDSQRWDKRLQIKVVDGKLYHGKENQEARLDHAKDEAGHASRLIGAELGYRVKVHPVMVIYGPSITWVIMKIKGVDVFDGGRIGTYFRRQSKTTRGHHRDPKEVARVFAAAERALPPLS